MFFVNPREQLPIELRSYGEALDVSGISGSRHTGYTPNTFQHAPLPIPGMHPADVAARGSVTPSTGVCIRLDLSSGVVPRPIADGLRRVYPGQVGGDGALYEYQVDENSSQRANLALALSRLAAAVREVGSL